ncbi:FAD/NAD(P)-binding domain-containing protein [Aaosphaeria arxii CBS 175.79]|uniref:FAD/NAD(P)-binding domain-containing protein n=1 Tax=Aaosphaeria arxii CBS 175.79 TaxID=1450172 RepID=A0A6A5XQG2_9PLEO|nr:FAD/NAD(P)-binding domain-containing protein [Aaosphaeria arxii CBS 175.79]KAF2015129.1 FAD/NAD(P)-binding domain-containing protein [Aaosphaeria arxii CBS 175.79]
MTTPQYEPLRSTHDLPLTAIVIGAGLGGCAAAIALHHHGHRVLCVLDKVREFGRLGDSLGLGENAFTLLQKWGCPVSEIKRIGNQAPNMTIRRWRDGKVLAVQPLMDMAGYIGHRGDYHDVFLSWVRARGIPIRMGSEVVAYDDVDPQPIITLKSGERLKADVIVAADGIKSLARPLVLGVRDDPVSSGYACFRAFFKPTAEQRGDARINKYMGEDCVNFWIGPDTHLVQNTLRGGEEFNWIITHKDDGDVPESWFQEGDMEEVRRLVMTLDPDIRGIVEQTERCLDWKICYREPLSTWVSAGSHRIVLLGDSCHAHLPTSAQGASQAVESAGVLATALDLVNGRDEVGVATRSYEKLRFGRTRLSQLNGEDLRDRWHGILKSVDEDRDIDPEDVKIKNRWLYSFDAEEDAEKRWKEVRETIDNEFHAGQISPLC